MQSGQRMSFGDELERRLYEWALDVIRFCRLLGPTAEGREMASQLRRASTSASANYRASRRGRSQREWLSKIGIVLEELDESDHWLTMVRDSGAAIPPQNLLTECRELRAILAKSASTARKRMNL